MGNDVSLSPEELSRYSRHIRLPQVGVEGQERLRRARVLVIGMGGLGSPVSLYLAAGGVGTLGLADFDKVEEHNLQRQVLHTQAAVGHAKIDSAAERLRALNRGCNLELHRGGITLDNAVELISQYDLVVDGSDNFPTRYLVNDAAYFARRPLVYGSIFQFEGQVSVFDPHTGGPCYRCLLPEPPAPGAVPSCNEAGVLGVLPGIIGSLQAMEAIKLILGSGEPPLGKILTYDALRTSFRSLKLPHDPACRLCGDNPTIISVTNPETSADPSCEIHDPTMQTITAAELKARLDADDLNAILIDVRDQEEWDVVHIPQAKLVPLQTIPTYAPNLPKDTHIIIHCKAGMRSAKACEYLTSLGFENITNVTGGMDAFQKL